MTWRYVYSIEVMLDRFLPELWPFNNFSTVSLVFALLLQFSADFSETFQLLFQWSEEDHIKSRSGLTAFYQNYGPLSVLAILSTEVLVSAPPPTFFKGFWLNFPVIVPMTWKWSYLTEVMLDCFLPELWPFGNFSTVSLVSSTHLAVFSGFYWYLPVIVPMTWIGSY